MPSITTDQGILHYEVFGRGRPVIFLHGWLGSVGLWQESMTYFGQYYRTYSLDFWGFGESGRKCDTFAVHDFVSMVEQFMDQLGITSAPLVGHSMGGTVSLAAAVRHPGKIQQVTVIGSPIHGDSLAPLLKLSGRRWVAWLVFRFFGLFRKAMYHFYSPLICKDPRFPDMMDKDLTWTSLDSFLTSIATLRRTDLRPDLHHIKAPVMGMYGDKDLVVHTGQWQPLQAGVSNVRIERFQDAGHFIMLDTPQKFREMLKAFLDSYGAA